MSKRKREDCTGTGILFCFLEVTECGNQIEEAVFQPTAAKIRYAMSRRENLTDLALEEMSRSKHPQ